MDKSTARVTKRGYHHFSSFNRAAVSWSTYCGCFYCCTTFKASEVKKWVGPTDRKGNPTMALCPHCGIDAVLPDALVELSDVFLKAMNAEWFDGHLSGRGIMEMRYKKLSEDPNTKVPEWKKWLHQNAEVLASVRRDLGHARNKVFALPPNTEEIEASVEQCEDEDK